MSDTHEVRLGLGAMGGDKTQNYITVDGVHLATWLRQTGMDFGRIKGGKPERLAVYTMTGVDAPSESDARHLAELIAGSYCGTFLGSQF